MTYAEYRKEIEAKASNTFEDFFKEMYGISLWEATAEMERKARKIWQEVK